MRLTLRTLLAYLDDTLQAGEIKEIGQKVSESEPAQELISRIKQVTRRRRLTVPPATGPNGFDPNDVAEYLDNELDTDKVAELEKQCLDSDVHLAEIAACHQILALVLGEPAQVPPTAKERMYGLVRGKEAIPSRRAAPARKAPGDALDEDEALGLGGRWGAWLLPVAGLLLIVTLGFAVYQLLDRPKDDRRAGTSTEKGGGQASEGVAKDDGKGTGKPGLGNGEPKNGKPGTPPVKPGPEGKGDGGKGAGSKGTAGKDKDPEGTDVARVPAPSKDRKPIGKYAGAESGLPSLLVSRQTDRPLARVAKGGQVNTSDTLIALPGFVSEVRTDKGVKVILRGSMPELALAAPMLRLLDSAVVLHASDTHDLDLSLLRGRIYLRNNKAETACKIRLRLDEETWDLELSEPGDEVCVDLTQDYTPLLDPAKDQPERHAHLGLLRGKADVTTNAFLRHTMELGPSRKFGFMHYSSTGTTQAPRYEPEVPLAWKLTPPTLEQLPKEVQNDFKPWVARVKAFEDAMKELAILAGDAKLPPVTELREKATASVEARRLAIYAMGAMDELSKLIDALGDTSPVRAIDREAAFLTLRAWASRGPGMAKALYTVDKDGQEAGLLITRDFKSGEAKTICDLLYPFKAAQLGKVEPYEYLVLRLQSKKVAIAEMAYHHLTWLTPPKLLPPGFNAAAGDDRRAYAERVQELIDKKLLPPGQAVEGKDKEKKE